MRAGARLGSGLLHNGVGSNSGLVKGESELRVLDGPGESSSKVFV